MRIYLKPVFLREKYFLPIEDVISDCFNELFYIPIKRILNNYQLEMRNSIGALLEALNRGAIYYHEDEFHGEFNSTISKTFKSLGAVFNGNRNTWKLPRDKLPPSIIFAIAEGESRYRRVSNEIISLLETIDVNEIQLSSDLAKKYLTTVSKIDNDLAKTLDDAPRPGKYDKTAGLHKALESIAITPKLTEKQKEELASAWGKNLNLYIKDWTAENIINLRRKVEKNTLSGQRAEGLVKLIEENYGTSKAKAKFLARQETSLLMSKMREQRYKDAGIEKYVWSGSMDERERHDHKLLEGTIQRWDTPPIVNRKTGARAHVGEDFGCRCLGVPYLE